MLSLIAIARWFRRAGRARVLVLVGLSVTIIVVGAALFSLTQHIDYGVALYWSITTATTVGYGDVTPHNTAGRVIAAVVMLTTIPIVGAIFAMLAGATALAHIRRILGMDAQLPQGPFTLVYGSHPICPHVMRELRRSGERVVLVAAERPAGLEPEVEYLGGDPADEATVQRSQPSRADRALIACESDADTLIVAVALHHNAPDLEVFALTQSRRVARALVELGITHTLSSDELVGHTLAKSLETPQAGNLLLQLVGAEDLRLGEQPVDPALVSRTLSQARGTAGSLVLGIARDGRVDLGVGDDPVLAAGDRLIVLEPAAP
jgi:voltage-gated potassium channel